MRSHIDELSSSGYSNLSSASSTGSQIQELKIWCQNSSNKQTLLAISYSAEESFHQVIYNALFGHQANDYSPNETFKTLNKIHEEIYNLIKEIYYPLFTKSEFMCKNILGLNKLTPRTKSNRFSESNSLSSVNFNIAEARSENNLQFDQEMVNKYFIKYFNDYKYLFLFILFKNYFTKNPKEMEHDNEDLDYPTTHPNLTNRAVDDATDSINEEIDDYPEEEFNEDTSELEKSKQQQAIRLDLINEIKDEILDDTTSGAVTAEHQDALEEDEVDYAQEEEIEPNDLNLSNLRILIDDIEELTDKSNKTCFVFAIQVIYWFC